MAVSSQLLAGLIKDANENLKPPPKLNLVEWADEKRMLSPEASSEAGKWRTSRVEVARGPMLAATEPGVREITVVSCTQLLKTEILLNLIGYFVDQDPASILVMQPTLSLAQGFSKDRVDPMFRDTPCLAGKLKDKRSREGGNTMLHKTFPGGYLTIVGANSPTDLASRPVRVVLCDEVDKYPTDAGGEGDPIRLASERSATFFNRLLVKACSPTVAGRSRIAAEYDDSDRRVFQVPCPHCGDTAEMRWANVTWPDGEPEKAGYV
jgi:phage terminase large subunit GpA-like protein